ncbi:MAG: hypothetical protein R3A80_07400 [Bdellovibrionota bacterium]
MKSLIRTALIASTFFGFMFLASAQVQNSQIKKININYSRLLLPVDRQGFAIPQAIIGGQVDFEGVAPAYVTLIIGGQSYTQPTDRQGFFSFLAYTANASNYTLEAWLVGAETDESGSAKITVENALK